MSTLFSSPDASDFSQGLVFYPVKAAGCVCFSGARGGGGRRRKGIQLGMPDPPGSRKSGGGKGREAKLRGLLLA